MPAQQKSFTVHVDSEAVALGDLAALSVPPLRAAGTRPAGAPAVDEHHGAAGGGKLAVRARQQADRARSGRAAAGKARYAFRRS